jgi:hypothetical protein
VSERPVLYLDVDDTLIMWNDAHPYGKAAPWAREFVLWAVEHCEVRWLTMWCPAGRMAPHREAELALLLGVPVETLDGIRGIDFADTFDKTDGIDWEEHARGRPWIWVEDDLPSREVAKLRGRGAIHHYHATNVSRDAGALGRTFYRLQHLFAQSAA